MLCVLQLDACNRALCDRLAGEGRMPAYAELRRRGRLHELETPGTYLAASTYHSLYTGQAPSEHGLHYALQWKPDEQRIRFLDAFTQPPAIWEQAADAGLRCLVVDPYESWAPSREVGTVVSGWQFQNVVALERWSHPGDALPRLERAFGRSSAVQEVFGRPSSRYLRALRSAVLAAPARLAEATIALLRDRPYDLVWVTCLATHLGGHQFWSLDQLRHESLDPLVEEALGSTLEDVYEETDRAFGRILAALPGDADVLLFSPLGIDEIRSRVDMLPEMLGRVLAGTAGESPAMGLLWVLRASVPMELRARASRILHGPATRELMARLATARVDWSRTPAFVLPSDEQGQIRLNVRGRERDGILDPAEARELEERIADGLLSFRDADGGEAVAGVYRSRDVFGDGPGLDLLPDLIVRWSDRPSTGLAGLVSPRYGEVARRGVGSGRAGGHTDDAFALYLPAGAAADADPEPGSVVGLGAVALAVLGADAGARPGPPLGERTPV